MSNVIGRPSTRFSRKVLMTSRKTGRTYTKYIYNDAQVRRSRSTNQRPTRPGSAGDVVRKGLPIPRMLFEKSYPGKSYKRYREKLKRVKERLR